MCGPAQNNPQVFEEKCRAAELALERLRSTAERFVIPENSCRFGVKRQHTWRGATPMEVLRFEEKLAIRQKMVAVFQRLDEYRREQGISQDT